MKKILFVLFNFAFNFFIHSQSKDLKKAFDAINENRNEDAVVLLQKYRSKEREIDLQDEALYYWCQIKIYSTENTNKDLVKAYTNMDSFLVNSIKFRLENDKKYFKFLEKFYCTEEDQKNFFRKIDAQLFQSFKYGEDIFKLKSFIQAFRRSDYLYEASDLIDEIRVKNAIRNGDLIELQRFTRADNYNTEPYKMENKNNLFTKFLPQVKAELEKVLIQKVRLEKDEFVFDKLKSKFPNSSSLVELQKIIIDEKVRQIDSRIASNEVDLYFLFDRDRSSIDSLVEKVVWIKDGANALSVTKIIYDLVKCVERKFYFDAKNEIICLDYSVIPFTYELPEGIATVVAEKKRIYFSNNQVFDGADLMEFQKEYSHGVDLLKSNTGVEENNFHNLNNKRFIPTNKFPFKKNDIDFVFNYQIIENFDGTNGKGLNEFGTLEISKPGFSQQVPIFYERYSYSDENPFQPPELYLGDYNFDGFTDLLIVTQILGLAQEPVSYLYSWNPEFNKFSYDIFSDIDLSFFDVQSRTASSTVVGEGYGKGYRTKSYKYDAKVWRLISIENTWSGPSDSNPNKLIETYSLTSLKKGKFITKSKR
ncbi:MAG: hypothetical protein ACK452_04710 [Bacteroidota bacterium]